MQNYTFYIILPNDFEEKRYFYVDGGYHNDW